jgi:hypothetical protein
MLELYLAIALFGLGSYLNNTPSENTVPTKIKVEDAPVAKAPTQASNRCEKIVPRSFAEFLDPETKKLYEKANYLPNRQIGEKYPDDKESVNVDAIVSNLTGTQITKEEFMINDQGTQMLPFFGGKITQNLSEQASASKLAIHTGEDKLLNTHKKETKPKFKPSKKLSWMNGSPNMNETLQDRYNASNLRTGELPFEQVKVASGLNNKDGKTGKGGFHQTDINDIIRASYKGIDDLNVRQQITYTTPLNPASKISKRQNTTTISKNRPETAFHRTMADLFKTIGSTIKHSFRENFEARDKQKKLSRQEFGNSSVVVIKPKTIANTQESRRNTYENSGMRNVKINDGWSIEGETADYGKNGYNLLPNERDTTQYNTYSSNLGSIVKSITAPLSDMLKITKKQNTIGNPRPNGNMKAQMPQKQTVYDTNDVARTTIKETLIHNSRKGNVKGPVKLTVYDPNDVAKTTIKETLIHNNRKGNVGVGKKAPKVYDYDTKPKITIRNTLEQVDYRKNEYSANIPDAPTVHNQDHAKKTVRETTEDNVHHTNLRYIKDAGYTIDPADAPATNKQFLSDKEYIGGAGYKNGNHSNYDAANNASLNITKELLAKGRKPMGSNVKIVNGKDKLNILYKKQMGGINAERIEKGRVYEQISSNDTIVYSNMRNPLSEEDRMTSDLLDAYKSNPYTQSLSSF